MSKNIKQSIKKIGTASVKPQKEPIEDSSDEVTNEERYEVDISTPKKKKRIPTRSVSVKSIKSKALDKEESTDDISIDFKSDKQAIVKKEREKLKTSKKIMTNDIVTFLLKWIEHRNMVTRYRAGEFKTIKIISLIIPKSSINKKNLFAKVYSTDPKDGTYEVEDSQGNKIIYATTGITKPENCVTCRKSLKDIPDPAGFPIRIKCIFDKVYIHYVSPSFCDLRCSYTNFLKTCDDDDPIYSNTKELYHIIYERLHPSTEKKFSKLTPKNDWELLDLNGGSLSLEEYESENNFKRTINYISVTNQIKYTK